MQMEYNCRSRSAVERDCALVQWTRLQWHGTIFWVPYSTPHTLERVPLAVRNSRHGGDLMRHLCASFAGECPVEWYIDVHGGSTLGGRLSLDRTAGALPELGLPPSPMRFNHITASMARESDNTTTAVIPALIVGHFILKGLELTLAKTFSTAPQRRRIHYVLLLIPDV